MALVTACGGSDSSNDGGSDATTDVAFDNANEAASDTATTDSSDASCSNDVDLTQYLPSADASIDVDAGGYDLAACTGCLKTDCTNQINACNQDCACRQTIIDLVTCVAQTSSFQTCGESALENSDQTGQSLLGCAIGNCEATCLGSADAGKDAISDAADGGG